MQAFYLTQAPYALIFPSVKTRTLQNIKTKSRSTDEMKQNKR